MFLDLRCGASTNTMFVVCYTHLNVRLRSHFTNTRTVIPVKNFNIRNTKIYKEIKYMEKNVEIGLGEVSA